jgi:hypothetical protein
MAPKLRIRSVLIAVSEYVGRAICQAQIERFIPRVEGHDCLLVVRCQAGDIELTGRRCRGETPARLLASRHRLP